MGPSARDVYRLQEDLLAADVRATDEMRERVAEGQKAVGGVVYRIPAVNLPFLREKLDKLAARAEKKGMATFAYAVDPEVERIESKVDPLTAYAELGYVPPRVQTFRYVAINAPVVKIEGWSLLATLSVEPGGVMVSAVPGVEADFSAYRDPATATECDHCGLRRQRTETFLVRHEDGSVKRVGRNCLRDFLGTDPNELVRWAQYVADVLAIADEESGWGAGSAGREWIETEEYLTHVCGALRTIGWVGASEYHPTEQPTKTTALQNILDYGKKDRNGKEIFFHVTDEDAERAREALAWAREIEPRSEFDQNMLVAVGGEIIPRKGLGILAYVPVAYARFQEREIQRAERAKSDAASEWVGQEKERLTLTLTVTAIHEYAGHYGTTFITTLRDEAGNVFKWFGSYELERGATVTGKWTVKGHEEYKGTKQTVINRPAFEDQREPVNVYLD